MRFYSIGYFELMNMEPEAVSQLVESIPCIEAHEQLLALKVSDFPMMKPEARQKLHRSLNKLANPNIIKEEEKALTTEDLAKILNRG